MPAVVVDQWAVVGAEVLGQLLTGDDEVEHPAQRRSVDVARMQRKSDDAAGGWVHDDHNPVGLEEDRFATYEIDTPETILHVAKECQPGRPTAGAGLRLRVWCEELAILPADQGLDGKLCWFWGRTGLFEPVLEFRLDSPGRPGPAYASGRRTSNPPLPGRLPRGHSPGEHSARAAVVENKTTTPCLPRAESRSPDRFAI